MPSNAIGSPSRSKPPTPAQDKKVPASPRPKARQSFDSPLIRAKKAPSGSVTGLRQETEDLLSTLSTPVKLRSPARHSKTPLNKRRESLDFSSVVSETSAQSVRSVALALSDLNVSNAKVDVFSSPLASARYLDPKNDELVVESDFVGGETVTFSKLSLDSLLLAESDLVPAVSIEGEDTSDKSDPLGLGNSEMIQDMPMPAFDSANDGMTSLASQETLVLQPDTLVTGDKKRKDVSEFDPLDSQDWMLRFDTPKKESRSDEEVALVDKRKQTPVRSLIDDFGPLATPNSMVKYTQRDVDRLKAEWQAKV